jgi:D-alanyl-lipoteichoic acid acyltransferase DltB (MBOAT superfamily)
MQCVYEPLRNGMIHPVGFFNLIHTVLNYNFITICISYIVFKHPVALVCLDTQYNSVKNTTTSITNVPFLSQGNMVILIILCIKLYIIVKNKTSRYPQSNSKPKSILRILYILYIGSSVGSTIIGSLLD